MSHDAMYEQYNPWRRPEWRWDRVLTMTERLDDVRPGRSSRSDDAVIRAGRKFHLRYRAYDEAGRKQLGRENPGLFWAYKLFMTKAGGLQSARDAIQMECKLLARMSDEEIAGQRMSPDTVKWYEALFFNVRDLIDDASWVVNHVLLPILDAEPAPTANVEATPEGVPLKRPVEKIALAFYDPTIYMFAYFGGPLILDFFLAGFRQDMIARNRSEVGEWFDEHWMNRVRQRSAIAAQTCDINRYNVMQFFDVHKEIMLIRNSKENEEVKHDQMQKAIQVMMAGMNWAVGNQGKKMVANTVVSSFDEAPAELRDEELLILSSGRKIDHIEDIKQLTLPEPRRKTAQEESANANAQQGS